MRSAPYGLVAALIFVRFADEWATFLPAGSLEPMRRDLGLTYAQVAAILVALPAGGFLGSFFLVAADYVSRRLLASLGALAYGLAMIAFGCSHTLTGLLVASFVWGAASDAFIHGCEVALVDLAEDQLPKALARMHGWAAVGDLLGPLTVAAAAMLGLSWRAGFIGLGLLMFGYAAWVASQRFPPPKPPQYAPNPLAGILAIARDRRVLMLALVLGLFSLLDEPLAGFMIAYLERVRRLSPALAAMPVMAILIGGMAGYAGYERLLGLRPARTAVVACAGLMAAALPAALFAPCLALQVPAAFAFGLAASVFYTTLDAIVLGLRPGQVGATSAVVSTVGMIGIGFPALVGLAADAWGLGPAIGLYALIPVLVLALVAADRK